MISIRPAAPEDTDQDCAYIRELAEYEKLTHEAVATTDDIRAALFPAEPKAFCDLAEWSGEPAGFALWIYTFSTYLGRHGIYLEDLYVRPRFRGRGIGKALLEGLARRCAAERLGRLEWAVLNWNTPSIAFYEALGARPMNDWTVYRLTGDALQDLATREEA